MSKHNSASKLLIGTTVLAVVAAGVVSFFTRTQKGKKLWKDSVAHTMNLMKIATAKAEKVKQLTERSYARLVDEVIDEYAQHKELTKDTSTALARALKQEWKTVKKGLSAKPRGKK